MKKLLLALSVASLFAAPVMAEEEFDAGEDPIANAPAVAGPKGQIFISGELQTPTCRLADETTKVVLDKLDVTDVEKKTNTGLKNFSIDLVDCSPYLGKSVTLKLTPQETSLVSFGEEKLLLNSIPTPSKEDVDNGFSDLGARNVGFKITSKGVNALNNLEDLSQFALYGYKQLNKSEVSFGFSVEYAKTTDKPVTPGLVQAQLPFTVIYK